MKNQSKYTFLLGAALFSMFFGAGNLIFPSTLGLQSGSSWIISFIGFSLTGICLPLLGIIASAKSGGSIDKLGSRVSKSFSIFLGIAISLAIGPLLAIPRTGATAFEMSGQYLIPNLSPIVFSIVYFSIALIFSLNKSKVVSSIGKYLTPGLLILLGLIIVTGIINPLGSPVESIIEKPFAEGFTQGYQTMDALASILFGGIIVATLDNDGIKDKDQQVEKTKKAGIIAAIGLVFVYGGLSYLGSRMGTIHDVSISRAQLLMSIAEANLKVFGKISLSIIVSLACLTTTVGLISSISEYFEELSKGRLKYKPLAIAMTVFSAFVSVRGVENIIKFSAPVLVFLYPMTIVLILLSIFLRSDKPNKNIYRAAVFASMIIGLLEVLQGFDLAFAKNILGKLPLNNFGIAWLVPALLSGFIASFIKDKSLEIDQ